MLNRKSVLITGGTGSFGKKFIDVALSRYPHIERILVFSRDELKQFEMREAYPESNFPQLRFVVGDVRDHERVARAMEGVDIVIHAAALKQVPSCEYNPFEAVRTNVIGAQNVIDSALDAGVRRVVALSTDKAAAAINLYGATKLCSDKLFVAANNLSGHRDIAFSVVRYGNVMGSRGSLYPFFLEKRRSGSLPVTDDRMTRFNITLAQSVDFVLAAIGQMWGGELFIPKIPSYRILDVVEAIAPSCKIERIGIRPGEKLHEDLITETDAYNTVEFADYYVILPSSKPVWSIEAFVSQFKGTYCVPGFHYSSGKNTHYLTVEEIRDLIRVHLDSKFEPL